MGFLNGWCVELVTFISALCLFSSKFLFFFLHNWFDHCGAVLLFMYVWLLVVLRSRLMVHSFDFYLYFLLFHLLSVSKICLRIVSHLSDLYGSSLLNLRGSLVILAHLCIVAISLFLSYSY